MADGAKTKQFLDEMKIAHLPEAPEPLFRNVGEPERFPLDQMPLVLKQGAMGVQGRTQAPIALCAQSCLAALSLGASRLADIRLPSGQSRPLSLYLITIAASGERKSSADNEASKPIMKWESQEAIAYQQDMETYRIKAASFETAEKELHKRFKKDRVKLEDELRKLGPPPPAPFCPFALVGGDPTPEGLWLQLSTGMGFAGIFSAEGGSFVGGHAMGADHKLRTAAVLSEAWDGSPMRRTRRGDGVSVLNQRRVCAHLMLQPASAAGFLADPVLRDQGLLSRMLACEPATTMGSRFGRQSAESEQALREYLQAVEDLWLRPVMHLDHERGALDLRVLELEPDAHSGLLAFGEWVENQLGPGGLLRTISGFANKLAEHATRLAGVFAMSRDPDITSVSAEDAEAGIELARWYASEALRLHEGARLNITLSKAETLRAWLCSDTWPHQMVSLPDIYQFGPSEFRSKDEARKFVEVLVEHGWLAPLPDGALINGKRRKQAWLIRGRG